MPESWMLATLKRETHRQQITADADRLQLIGSVPPTRGSYAAFLKRVFGFEAPVQGAFAMTTDLEEVVDVRGRAEVRRLRCDLAALGVADPTLVPRCSTISPFRGVPEALGWMYVVDRNSLLHAQLHHHLLAYIPAELEYASAYLTSFERPAATRWRELGEALDRCARNRAHVDRIVNAAKAAFRCQRFWYEDRLPSHVLVA